MKTPVLVSAYMLFMLSTLVPSLEADTQNNAITYHAAFVHESVAFPINPVKLPVHPGCTVGVNIPIITKGTWQVGIDGSFLWFYHKWLEHGLLLDTALNVLRYAGPMGIKLRAGIGVYRAITDPGLYIPQGDGTFVKSAFPGKFFGSAKVGIGVESKHFQLQKISVAPFVYYDTILVFPYSTVSPVLPHTFLIMGIKVGMEDKE